MQRNHFTINLVLLILIVFLCVNFYKVVMYSVEMPSVPEAVETPLKSVSIEPKIRLQDESAFNVIADRNIFNPSRSLAAKVTTETAPQTSSKDVPKLFGTIILGDKKSAILKDPVSKVTRTYSINDAVGAFVLIDIQQDMVVLSRDDEVIEVRLREGKKNTPAPRSRSRNQRPVPKLQKKPPTPPKAEEETP
jgi:hypothetical protein